MSDPRAPGRDEVYQDLPGRCAKIDRRSTRYRFALEEAVPWDRLGQPGAYFGLELLETLGLEVAPLRGDGEALACFEWAFAVATCEEFIELEEVVLAYLAEERAAHAGIRSITLLEEEERKHIELFRRYARELKRQRPTWAPAAERALPRGARQIVIGDHFEDPRVRAYLFWLFTVLFEEYTIYLHDRLVAVPDIQPAWRAAHAAHRREEEQHVITDREHLRAVRLEPGERDAASRRFLAWIAGSIHDFTGLETARRCFLELRPDVPLALAPFAKTGLRRDIGTARSFRWTREAAPVLAAPAPAPTPPRVPEKVEEEGLLRNAWSTARKLARSLVEAADGSPTPTRRYRMADLAQTANAAPPSPARDDRAVAGALETVQAVWARALALDAPAIDPDASFTSLGGDSLKAVQMHAHLEELYQKRIPLEILLECRTAREMAVLLLERHGRPASRPAPAPAKAPPLPAGPPDDAVAIIAAACRFPGAADLDELWALLQGGRTSFREVPRDRWDASTLRRPACTTGAFLDEPGAFDAGAFGLGEAEARTIDPQQRLFLELAADLADHATSKDIGVFAGTGGNEYFLNLSRDLAGFDQYTALGNLANMVAARAAQVLGLRGPAMTIDAACASSLVAVHLACKSLLAGECELAIAGGVQTNLTQVPYAMFGATGVLSPSGRCQPYSTGAAGFVPGEGGGAVLLKRLAHARADGDRVLAVVRGGAINNDGGGLSGMAPTPAGQADVIRRALAAAGLDPGAIGYVEGHGSATPIGDVVETRALGQVFGAAPGLRYLGSIKANLGHCFAAAGIAGLLKVLLALVHRKIPPTPGCESPAERLFAGTSFAPTSALTDWPGDGPRRAGVSAFGVGGTNCHLVLEEASAASPGPARPPGMHLLAVSAPTVDELRRAAGEKARRLAAEPRPELAAFVAGVSLRARRHDVRRAGVVTTVDEAVGFLQAVARAGAPSPPGPARLCLVFSGPGSQYPGMGRALHEREPVFRAALRECAERLGGALERPLEELLFEEPGTGAPAMDRIEVTQPVIFSFGYALWRWLAHLGVVADGVLGHSAAEYLAAHVAGALSLEDALRLVSERGRAMAATGPGKMAAVFASEERVRRHVEREPEVGFAALNEPSQVVVSGRVAAVDRLLSELAREGIAAQELRISCAAHSPAMREAAERLMPHLERATFRPLRIPFYSTVTGQAIGAGGLLDASYFARQLSAPVAFARAVSRAHADGFDAFVEVGASGALSHCVEQVLGPAGVASATVTPLLRRSLPGLAPTLEALATLFERRVACDPGRLGRDDLPLVPEPYPYQRRRLWLEPPRRAPRPVLEEPAPRLLTPDSEPSIRDHVFRERAIAPAALFLELLLAEARRRDRSVSGLARVLVSRSLGLEGGARRVWTRADGPALVVESAPEGGAPETHCAATPTSEPVAPRSLDLGALRARLSEEIPAERLYRHLAACRMIYGPSMTTVVSVRRGADELLARLELPAGAERPEVTLHPSLLDGAMQSIGAFFVDLSGDVPSDATFFGFSIQRLEVHAPVRTSCWAHVRSLLPLSPDMQSIRCDVDLFADDGRVLVAYHDVTLRRVQERPATATPPGPPAPATGPASTGLCRYAVTRVAAPRPAADASTRRPLPGELLLVGGGDEARAFQRALEDLGVPVLALPATTDEAALRLRLRRLAPLPRAVAAFDPGVEALYVLCRSLAAAHAVDLDDLLVVSRDPTAQALLRVVALEQDGWSCRGVELTQPASARLLRALVDEWREGAAAHVYLGDGARERTALAPLSAGAARSMEGVVWITGGLGGVGQHLARRLLAAGARVLVTGRRLPADAAPDARLLYIQADASDPAAMRAARDRAEATLGPIRGLIHAAGVVDQALLGERPAEAALAKLAAVLRPKREGGHVLAQLLGERALDFVAFCSSMVALYGAPGQADYAAANAALDELARQWPGPARRVVSIAWGPWRDTGMMAAPASRGVFDAQGLVPLDPDAAADALLATVCEDLAARHVLIVDVQTDREPLLHERLGGPAPSAAQTAPAVVPEPAGLAQFLLQELARTLRRPVAAIDPRAPFRQLGLDSLMAVRIVQRLEAFLGLELHPTLLFEQPNVDAVVRHLEQRTATREST